MNIQGEILRYLGIFQKQEYFYSATVVRLHAYMYMCVLNLRNVVYYYIVCGIIVMRIKSLPFISHSVKKIPSIIREMSKKV